MLVQHMLLGWGLRPKMLMAECALGKAHLFSLDGGGGGGEKNFLFFYFPLTFQKVKFQNFSQGLIK